MKINFLDKPENSMKFSVIRDNRWHFTAVALEHGLLKLSMVGGNYAGPSDRSTFWPELGMSGQSVSQPVLTHRCLNNCSGLSGLPVTD